MQVRGLPRHIIRAGLVASKIAAQPSDSEAAIRRDLVRRWRQARRDGLSALQAARAVGVSRATLYRWRQRPEPRSRRPHRLRGTTWSPHLVLAVERLRLDFPMWGKAKLAILLRREGFTASQATIGRILKSLVERGVVQPAPRLRQRPQRWSPRRRYAVRLPKGLRPDQPGGLVQIDTVFVNLAPGKAIKHFTAYCPVARWTVGQAFKRATAKAASLFLDKVLAQMPFKVHAIQVDGGAEFKAEFEQACQAKAIRLYELPPGRPQLNGAVERCNAAWRYEFYQVYDLPTSVEALNPLLDSFQHLYNHHRPHQALAGLTPAQYLSLHQAHDAPASHLS